MTGGIGLHVYPLPTDDAALIIGDNALMLEAIVVLTDPALLALFAAAAPSY